MLSGLGIHSSPKSSSVKRIWDTQILHLNPLMLAPIEFKRFFRLSLQLTPKIQPFQQVKSIFKVVFKTNLINMSIKCNNPTPS